LRALIEYNFVVGKEGRTCSSAGKQDGGKEVDVNRMSEMHRCSVQFEEAAGDRCLRKGEEIEVRRRFDRGGCSWVGEKILGMVEGTSKTQSFTRMKRSVQH